MCRWSLDEHHGFSPFAGINQHSSIDVRSVSMLKPTDTPSLWIETQGKQLCVVCVVIRIMFSIENNWFVFSQRESWNWSSMCRKVRRGKARSVTSHYLGSFCGHRSRFRRGIAFSLACSLYKKGYFSHPPVTCCACALQQIRPPECVFHSWCTIANRYKQALINCIYGWV